MCCSELVNSLELNSSDTTSQTLSKLVDEALILSELENASLTLPELMNTSEPTTNYTSITLSEMVNASELNISDTSLADECDYTNGQQLCGDVCIKDKSTLCTCGDGQQFSMVLDQKYCCLEKLAKTQCHVGDDGGGYCKSGQTLNATQPCNNQCYNDYSGNNTAQILFKCKTVDQCVFVQLLCHGVAYCPDKSDLEICNSDIQCVSGVQSGFTKYDIHTTIVTQHSECGYHYLDNNGHYNTLSRRDETNLNIATQTGSNIDYTTLHNCTYDRLPGLTCDSALDGCAPNYLWCRNDLSGSCNNKSFNANDKPLCSNNTFWRTQSCDIIEVDGVTRAVGQRCIGQAQSCYYPWYTTLNHWYEVRFNMY